MTYSLHGVAVSRGIAIGNVHILAHQEFDVRDYLVDAGRIEAEVARLRVAIQAAATHLRSMRDKIPAHAPHDIAAFIDTHLLMLADTALADEPIRLIRERRFNAAWALKTQRDAIEIGRAHV